MLNRAEHEKSFITSEPGPEEIFFMLVVEHEILNADKYKNIKKFGFF